MNCILGTYFMYLDCLMVLLLDFARSLLLVIVTEGPINRSINWLKAYSVFYLPIKVLTAQDLVDFSPVYRCLHIYTVLVRSSQLGYTNYYIPIIVKAAHSELWTLFVVEWCVHMKGCLGSYEVRNIARCCFFSRLSSLRNIPAERSARSSSFWVDSVLSVKRFSPKWLTKH